MAKPVTMKRPGVPLEVRRRFAANVRAAVAATGETLSDISIRSGIRYVTLVSWARGDRIPEPENLPVLARALKTTVEALMKGVR